MLTTKLKICHKCKLPKKLWKSIPPTCAGCIERKPIAKKPNQIKKVSEKQMKVIREYSKLRAQFLRNHPICQARVKCSGKLATEVHHSKGRVGRLMLATEYFKAVCSECHRFITDNSEQAYALGLSERRLTKDTI